MPNFVPREWQTKCLERDHEFRRTGKKVFRIDACPGAGKSTMAAMLAASWLNDNELALDHVLVAAPWKSICQSMAEKFALLGLDTRERFFYGTKYDAIQKPPTMEGTVTTYQEISTEGTLKLIDFWKAQYGFRFALISDEIHHTKDELGVWGEFSEEIAKRAERVCVMSGTWFRGDGSAIRHVEYDSLGQPILDYRYPYITGVMDGVVRGVTARFVGGTVRLVDHERKMHYERSLDDITGREYGEAMREIFHPDSPVMRNLVEECWLDLQQAREKHRDAAALFVCRPGGGGLLLKI